jgi:hypothetical protein
MYTVIVLSLLSSAGVDPSEQYHTNDILELFMTNPVYKSLLSFPHNTNNTELSADSTRPMPC